MGRPLGIAHGLFFPAFNAIAFSRAGQGQRGKVMAVFTGAFYGGLGLGVMGLGRIADALGYAAVFIVTAAFLLAAGTVLSFSHALRSGAEEVYL